MKITDDMYIEAFRRHDQGESYYDIEKSLGVKKTSLSSGNRKAQMADRYLSMPNTPLSALNGFKPDMALGLSEYE